MAELLAQALDTSTAWRITRFINCTSELIGEGRLLNPMRQAFQTLGTHAERVVRRWTSTYTNARLEGLNGLFQAHVQGNASLNRCVCGERSERKSRPI